MKKLLTSITLLLTLSLTFCKKKDSTFHYSSIDLNVPATARSIEWSDSSFIVSGGNQEGNGYIYSYTSELVESVIVFDQMQYPIYDYFSSDSMHYFSAEHSRVYEGAQLNTIEIHYPDTAFWVNSLNKKALRVIEGAGNRGVFMAGGEGYTKGLIQYSNNNGESWIPYELDNEMRCLAFQEPNIMWCGGYGLLLRSASDDEEWEIQAFENTFITGMDFLDEDRVVLSNYSGDIYLSVNGGQAWSKVLKSNLSFNTVSFIDENRVVAIGNRGSIAVSYDSGNNWTFDKSFENSDLVDFVFKDERLFLLGDNGMIYIVDF